MWAQLIKVQLKPGSDLSALADVLKAAEQPGSGLVRELFMHDENDLDSAYILAVFESEEKAREREQDPRRAEGQQAIQELMGARGPARVHRSDRHRRLGSLASALRRGRLITGTGASPNTQDCPSRTGDCRSHRRGMRRRVTEVTLRTVGQQREDTQ